MRYRTAILALLFVAGLGCKEVFAGPALLFDVNTNKVLYAEEPDSLWYQPPSGESVGKPGARKPRSPQVTPPMTPGCPYRGAKLELIV